MNHLGYFFAALYGSDRWQHDWETRKRLYSKARAVFVFDRVMAERHCEGDGLRQKAGEKA